MAGHPRHLTERVTNARAEGFNRIIKYREPANDDLAIYLHTQAISLLQDPQTASDPTALTQPSTDCNKPSHSLTRPPQLTGLNAEQMTTIRRLCEAPL